MTDKAKVSREKILLHEESFSYLFFKGRSKHNPIIFFHATGLNAETYLNLLTKIYDNFDGERSIYAFDQRGHGLSEAEADHKKLKSWRQFSTDTMRAFVGSGLPTSQNWTLLRKRWPMSSFNCGMVMSASMKSETLSHTSMWWSRTSCWSPWHIPI